MTSLEVRQTRSSVNCNEPSRQVSPCLRSIANCAERPRSRGGRGVGDFACKGWGCAVTYAPRRFSCKARFVRGDPAVETAARRHPIERGDVGCGREAALRLRSHRRRDRAQGHRPQHGPRRVGASDSGSHCWRAMNVGGGSRTRPPAQQSLLSIRGTSDYAAWHI